MLHKLQRKYNKWLASNHCHLSCLEDSDYTIKRIWKLCPLYKSYLVDKYVADIQIGIYAKCITVAAMLNYDYLGGE